MQRKYGRIPDAYDPRDRKFSPPHLLSVQVPPSINLSDQMPPHYDQGQTGSCVGNGTAALVEHYWRRHEEPYGTPSRLAIYYFARYLEHTTRQDAGAMVRDGVKAVAKFGAALETQWPYIEAKFKSKPPARIMKEALQRVALSYESVPHDELSLKAALAAGHPIVFGFTVYESFESREMARTGILPMPQPHEPVLGGHCVVAIGYDDERQAYLCRNSWGSDWGLGGDFWMPYAFMHNYQLTADFWIITAMGPAPVV